MSFLVGDDEVDDLAIEPVPQSETLFPVHSRLDVHDRPHAHLGADDVGRAGERSDELVVHDHLVPCHEPLAPVG